MSTNTYANSANRAPYNRNQSEQGSARVREVLNFTNRAFSRSRKVYRGVPVQLVSECRSSGGPFLKVRNLMDAMTVADALEYAEMVSAWAHQRALEDSRCLDAVLDEAQVLDAEEDVWERRATSDRRHLPQFAQTVRRYIAAARLSLVHIDREMQS